MALAAFLSVVYMLEAGSSLAADSGPETCSSGIAVENPEENPLLVQDCEALLAARDILSQGGRRLVWTADTPMSKWEGISIGGTPSRVTELRIRGDNDGEGRLEGWIPPELGLLTGLVTLDLSGNSLKGALPTELGSLMLLKTLRIRFNGLSGEIPPEFGKLVSLQELNLYNNELVGEIPANLGQLKNMRRLILSHNNLTGEIPPELGGLPDLWDLSLESNQLSGVIPSELGDLSNLRLLILVTNELTGEIPEEFRTLKNLEWLQANHNQLTGEIPTWIGELSHLQVLEISDNRLTGSIPSGLGKLMDLTTLSLLRNSLAGGIPEELGNLIELRFLGLGGNSLSGLIPPALGNLVGLRELSLSGNSLTGEIPEGFGDLINLEALFLENNRLIGEIPSSLSELSQLRLLYLNNNKLTGDIPASLGNLTQLEYLFIHNNQLSGEIPAELGELTKLARLILNGNSLSGTIPPELGMLSNLQSLSLSLNQLTGEIPMALGELHNMEVFQVNHNGLSGCVPLPLSRFDGEDFDDTNLRFCFAVDDSPTFVDDPALLTVAEGDLLTIDESVLLANDMETANHPLRVTALSDPTNGTVYLDGSTIVYEHDGSETTGDSFTYTVADGVHHSTGGVTVSVTPVNDPPDVVDEAFELDEGETLAVRALVLLGNDSDAENDQLEVTAVGDALNGTVSLEGSSIVYEHDGSETTTDRFTYIVSDGTDSSEGLVSLTVAPVNDAPTADNDEGVLQEGGTLLISVLANDTDAENDPLEITAVGDAANGTVSLEGSAVVYEHDGSETTTDQFAYIVSDGTDSSDGLVTLTVDPVNDAPMAVNDEGGLGEGGTLLISVLANDSDAESEQLKITAVGDAVNGSVSLEGSAVVYEHDGSETTTGRFSYIVSDGTDSSEGLVTLTVVPVNDAPIAVGDAVTVDQGATLSIKASVLLANDSDVEGNALSVSTVGDAINGTVSLDGDLVIYEHDGTETTQDQFSYSVTDGMDTTTATVSVVVAPATAPIVPAWAIVLMVVSGTLVVTGGIAFFSRSRRSY